MQSLHGQYAAENHKHNAMMVTHTIMQLTAECGMSVGWVWDESGMSLGDDSGMTLG